MDLGPPSFISYDHDLAREHYPTTDDHQAIDYDKYTEKTGYDCAKWMVKYCADHDIKHPKYLVHSLNPIGRLNIKSYVESYNKSCN
jgi:hypothetical protein